MVVYLLENKKADCIIVKINEFISHYGILDKIQSNNGKEFCNSKFNDFCNNLNIEIIHSRPWNPQTNGIVETLHWEIKKVLFVEKLNKKK